MRNDVGQIYQNNNLINFTKRENNDLYLEKLTTAQKETIKKNLTNHLKMVMETYFYIILIIKIFLKIYYL